MTQKLLNLMSKTANTIPEEKMDAQFAEEFATFFLEKIEKKIRVQFQDIDEYIPESTHQFQCFSIFHQWLIKKCNGRYTVWKI